MVVCVAGPDVREAAVRHQRRAADALDRLSSPRVRWLAAGSDREDQISKDKYEDKGENKATRRDSLGHSTGHSRPEALQTSGIPDQRYSRELQRHSKTPSSPTKTPVLDQEPKGLLLLRLPPASVLGREVQYGYSHLWDSLVGNAKNTKSKEWC